MNDNLLIKIISRSIILQLLVINHAFALICPVNRNNQNKPILFNCENIQLVKESVDLYHHPLGIWIYYYRCELKNLVDERIVQEVAFNSGYEIGNFQGQLYSDEFKNFRVIVDGTEFKAISMKEQCPNYGDRIGSDWSNNNYTSVGFLNTWTITFRPEEVKHIFIRCSFVIKKPPIIYNPEKKDLWYTEQMPWIRKQYQSRAENEFKFPLSMGSFWAFYPDTIKLTTYYSNNWLTIESPEQRDKNMTFTKIYAYSEPVGYYSPPDNETSVLTTDYLEKRSELELKLLQSSFLAKYGKSFTSKVMRIYFTDQPWYYEDANFNNWYLNELDVKNLEIIDAFNKKGK
jgi:hypothetical protein